jgi:hypothetical protein
MQNDIAIRKVTKGKFEDTNDLMLAQKLNLLHTTT